VIYGSALVLVVAFAPRGIAGLIADMRRALRTARSTDSPTDSPEDRHG